MNDDFDCLTDDQLSDFAMVAFRLGLEHGRRRSPMTHYELWQHLDLSHYRRRKLHPVKLRQVYGAGFDIGAMQRRLKEEAERDADRRRWLKLMGSA